ncbi:MAG: hypothetical protein NTW28_19685, partial [Candidatus Solibacter sp.]|nr:hypothetical protein [Candidatus Solibacter sp.]
MTAGIDISGSIGGGAERVPGDCIILVDNAEITSLYPYLTQVTAEGGRMPASTAALSFESVRGDDGKWAVQDAGLLAPWKAIVIEAAFGDRTEEVFRGVIRDVTADYPNEAGAATV